MMRYRVFPFAIIAILSAMPAKSQTHPALIPLPQKVYQDMPLLKQFVDVMAQYKMNVFHFHLTDNPGYRVECRVHPELNAPASYLPTRYPGKFYTYAELNDFIAYCKQRGVMVVLEIDIPGHSDYFKRAFGVEMQDEKGRASARMS
jgi:N-acetyl-beta-hexosaminidase